MVHLGPEVVAPGAGSPLTDRPSCLSQKNPRFLVFSRSRTISPLTWHKSVPFSEEPPPFNDHGGISSCTDVALLSEDAAL